MPSDGGLEINQSYWSESLQRMHSEKKESLKKEKKASLLSPLQEIVHLHSKGKGLEVDR